MMTKITPVMVAFEMFFSGFLMLAAGIDAASKPIKAKRQRALEMVMARILLLSPSMNGSKWSGLKLKIPITEMTSNGITLRTVVIS